MLARLGEMIKAQVTKIVPKTSLKAEDFLFVRIGKIVYQALVEQITQLYQTLSKWSLLSKKTTPVLQHTSEIPSKFKPRVETITEEEEPSEKSEDEIEPPTPPNSSVSFLETQSSEEILSALQNYTSNNKFPSFFCSPEKKIQEKQIQKDCLERVFPLFINRELLWNPKTLSKLEQDEIRFPYEIAHQGFFAPIGAFMLGFFENQFPQDSLYAMNPYIKSSPNMPKEIKGAHAESIALWFLRVPEEKTPFYLKLLIEAFVQKGGNPSLFFTEETPLQTIQGEKVPCGACQGCLESEKEKQILQECKNPLQSLEELKESSFFSLPGLFSYLPFQSFLSHFWQRETCSFSSLEDLTDILTILTALKRLLPEEVSSYFKEPTEAGISYFPSKWIKISWEKEKKEANIFGYFPVGAPEKDPTFIGYSAVLNLKTRQVEEFSFFGDFAGRF